MEIKQFKDKLDEILKNDIAKIVISNKTKKSNTYRRVEILNKNTHYMLTKFTDKQAFTESAPALYRIFGQNKGNTPVIIYCKEERELNRLPKNFMISDSEEVLVNLSQKYGEDNVKVVEKSIENLRKIH